MPLLPFLNQLIAGFYSLLLFHAVDPKPAPGPYSDRNLPPALVSLTGNCDATYFHKILRAAGGKSILVNDLVQQPDGTFLLAGSIDNNFSNVDALLVKTDSSGNPLWQRSFDLESNDLWLRMAVKQDGNIILAGQTNEEWIIVSEVDVNGNTRWTKKISENKLSLYDMTLDNDGSILLTGTRFDLLDQSAAFFIKLNSTGAPLWSSIYDNTGNDLFLEIAQDAGGYYVTGTARAAQNNALITKLDRTNGTVIWTYQYDLDKRFDIFQQLHIVNNKLVVNGYSRALSTPIYNRQVNGIVGADGTLTEMKIFGNNIFNSDILLQNDGSYIIAQSNYVADAFVNVFRFDANNNMVWGKKKYVDVNRSFPFIQPSKAGGYIITSVERNSLGGSAFLVHSDSKGTVPVCPEITTSETVSTIPVTRLPFQFATVTALDILVEDTSFSQGNEDIGASGYCTSNCVSFNIVGDTTACIGVNQGVYRIERNEGCDLPVSWQVDAEFASIQSQNDTMVTLNFKEIGSFMLSASMETNCSTISDAYKIQVNVPLTNVNLGKDHSLCTGEYISFNAPGYKNYRWSTGSKENSLIVNQPGTYYLTVEDFCGNISSDTIDVFMANETFVNLGPDTTVCSYAPIELNAGEGYRTYLWQNGSGAQKLQVNGPGEYSVMVTNEFGCRAFDTIMVKEGNCYRGISFPNAFSPNGDGKNDLFKPAVNSFPEYYELKIYNRWGQLVFQTKDPQKGWDGKVKNLEQEQHGFIYTCTYKFPQAAEQKVRGSFIIVR